MRHSCDGISSNEEYETHICGTNSNLGFAVGDFDGPMVRRVSRVGHLVMTPIDVRDYDQLIAALRARVAELGVSLETVEGVAGLPERYAIKLLAPIPVKGVGRASLGPMLGALGLKIVVVEDAEALARVARRLVRKEAQYANTGMRTEKSHVNTGDSEWGRIMAARRMVLISPRQRTRLAKRAARARWAKRVKVAAV